MAFVAINKFPHPVNKNLMKVSRIVVLPHWQGYGIGMRMTESIIESLYMDDDVRLTTTLPIVQKYLWESDKWIMRWQGVPGALGKSSTYKKAPRTSYMETYRFLNNFESEDKITRTKCPKDKKRKYGDDFK